MECMQPAIPIDLDLSPHVLPPIYTTHMTHLHLPPQSNSSSLLAFFLLLDRLHCIGLHPSSQLARTVVTVLVLALALVLALVLVLVRQMQAELSQLLPQQS
ncbi:hypothetical protein ABZP36_011038 [Zizania latifolia]